jgi:SET domain-containing protein
MKFSGCLKYDCFTAKSVIHGKGLFSNCSIKRKKKIGSLAGIVKSKKKIPKLILLQGSVKIVELDFGLVLDSTVYSNALCFINHSCTPNCYLRIFKHHVEVYALRTIKKMEEITVDYGETHHEGKLRCLCHSKGCRMSI